MENEKKCKRAGCNKKYLEAENTGTSCKFHNGKPIFHDIKKGWECCQKVCYDWDEFQKIEGCCTGLHTDEAQDTEFWKSQTVQNAETGIQKEEMAKIKTADDFNKEQDEKDKRAKEVAAMVGSAGPVVEKKPKLNKDGRFICANKGCAKRTFTDDENNDTACSFHTGEAIFHDLRKYWSCCNPNGKGKVAYDWDEFMTLPTCATGPHAIKYV